ncbi:MAG TPA: ABC transporter permease [Pseudonocardiaceae bacterium]|nr:ABC transporter permease [Pseudonocardiaceae bacterium]
MNGSLTGAGALARFGFRRDRIMLPLWLYLLAATVLGTAWSFQQLYRTPAQIAAFAAGITGNAAVISITGPAYDLTSLGSLVMWRVGTWAGAFTGLMSLLLVLRHTRAEEEAGRLELVGSTVVGRHAALTAGLVIAGAANVLIGAVNAVGLIAFGLPVVGSLALGLSMCLTGWVFAALAALAAQLTESAGAARGLAASVLGVAFLLRAAGDAGATGGLGWLSWISPLGWGPRLRPFADERWWVLAIPLLATLVLTVGAYALISRRDFGAGLLASRPGPAVAARSLASPLALAWRLHRGALIGWTTGFAVFGAVIGNLAPSIAGMLRSSPQTATIMARLGGQGGLTDLFLSAMFGLFGLVSSAYAVQATLRLRTEESGQRTEPLLATGVGRIRWAASHVVLALAGTAVLLLAAGLTAGLVEGAHDGTVGHTLGRVLTAALVQVPAAWVLAGVGVLLFGVLPRFAVASWAAVVIVVLLGELGSTLRLPQAVLDVSPFTHVPKLPGGAVTGTQMVGLVTVIIVAAVLTVVGLVGFRRRDIDTQ